MGIKEIHEKVYTELKEKNPKHFVYDLSHEEIAKGENTYYKVLAENPKAYEEELQLFSVKPFFNFINLIFFKLGFEASTSIFLVSIISYVLILLLVFRFLTNILRNQNLAVFITIILSLFKPFLESSRHASPDNLACLLLLLSFYYFIFRKNFLLATIFAMLCIFTRPEYYIFYSFVFLLIFVYRKSLRISVRDLCFSYFYIGSSFFLIQYFNQISWSTLFMNQFTQVQIYPISNPDPFYFSSYFNFLKSNILLEFNGSYFPILLLFITIILAANFNVKNPKLKLYSLFFASIYIAVFIRFLIFPSLVNRMMLGYYLLIILALIYIQFSKEGILKKKNIEINYSS
ncbi:hypothetical protein [Chryseobacterium tagetis]|nr:hypothetical protein [Chryseobacterium tagetis]